MRKLSPPSEPSPAIDQPGNPSRSSTDSPNATDLAPAVQGPDGYVTNSFQTSSRPGRLVLPYPEVEQFGSRPSPRMRHVIETEFRQIYRVRLVHVRKASALDNDPDRFAVVSLVQIGRTIDESAPLSFQERNVRILAACHACLRRAPRAQFLEASAGIAPKARRLLVEIIDAFEVRHIRIDPIRTLVDFRFPRQRREKLSRVLDALARGENPFPWIAIRETNSIAECYFENSLRILASRLRIFLIGDGGPIGDQIADSNTTKHEE